MTESTSTTEPPSRSTPPTPSSRWGYTLFVLIFRLLLLGVGGSLAFAIGIAIATVFPGQIEQPPLLEQLLQRVQALRQGSPLPPVSTPTPSPPVLPSEPLENNRPNEDPESAEPPASSTIPNLTSAQRQQLETEVQTLQTTLQALGDRVQSLEDQLGIPATVPATTDLATRLQAMQQQLLAPGSAAIAPPTPVSSAIATQLPPIDPVTTGIPRPSTALMITLPSDTLFAPQSVSLLPTTTPILDSIVSDLRQYPDATILIAAHTDAQGNPAQNRSRSLDQARSLHRYLAGVLGDRYHWVMVGYGQAMPLVSEVTASSVRNRRIEIIITPHS